jgi:hypothetical protein
MKTLGRTITKKAGKATARHTVRGFGSKAKRKPFRSATLLSAGGALGITFGAAVGATLGAVAGFVVGRKRASHVAR